MTDMYSITIKVLHVAQLAVLSCNATQLTKLYIYTSSHELGLTCASHHSNLKTFINMHNVT
jgi:hypothetical protein